MKVQCSGGSSCPRTQCRLVYGHSTSEANWRGEKLNKWVTRKLTENQNTVVLKCFLLFHTTMNHFSIGSWCTMKNGFHTTISDNQFRGWVERKLQSTSQSQTCSKKKRSWSPFGGLLPVWSTIAFWILAKPLHLRSMLRKLMWCTKTCNACSCHWSTERA